MGDVVSLQHQNLINLLSDILGPHGKHYPTKYQIAYNCPVCSSLKDVVYDNKFNLEINYGKGVYKCWSCYSSHGTHGTILDLVKTFGNRSHLDEYFSLNIEYDYIIYNTETNFDAVKPFGLPSEFCSLKGKSFLGVYKKAFDYLNKRRINDTIIEKFNIGWCYGGDYEDRILLPSYDENDNLNYFVTRAIDPKMKPKYLNCDLEKTSIIFNLNLINWEKTVFIVEGPFDHIVTPNSLPLLGKLLYPLLHETLYDKCKSNIVVLTDPDAVEDGIKLYRQLDGGKLQGRVYINFLPEYYDPAKFYEKFGFEAYKNQLRKSTRLSD